MGSIALLRQTLYDAQWYKNTSEKETNLSLEALLNQLNNGTLFFEANDHLEIQRAEKIAEEFDLSFNYIGSGSEYKITSELKGTHGVLTNNLPEA